MVTFKDIFRFFSLLLSFLIMFSCQEKENIKVVNSENTTLFTNLSSENTGIHFINEIPENHMMNSMVYEYFYNGGGVSIGDINNDGFADIFFTSNLKENRLYLNNGDFHFEDITEKAKIKGSFGWSTGTTMVDINADGWLDIYVSKSGKGKAADRKNELFLNNKNGTFKEVAAQYGLDFEGYSTQASFFDFDKDGDLDVFLLNHNVSPINTNNPEKFRDELNSLVGDKLYRNDNGTFIDISKDAGIYGNSLGFGLGVSIGDLNQDGWPDIYVANDYIEQDYLYYNNGDGTFTESLKNSIQHTSNFSMGTDIADFNNDGLLDIISLDMIAEDNYGIKTSMSGMNPKAFNHAVDNGFGYQYMFNALQLNNGATKFSEIAHLSGVSNTDWSWAPLFADFDNDGYKDLFITNGLKRDFRNNDYRKQKLKRLEAAQQNGEKMSDVVGELVLNTPQRKKVNQVFKNNGDLTFSKVSTLWGIDQATFSNGVAYADLDNDGDLDVVVNNIDEKASVLKNNSSNNYLQFQFVGNPNNPFGIGTRVELHTEHGIQVVENYPTRGYQSSMEPILHLGLKDSESAKKATITWSDGKVQVLENISANKRLKIHYKDAAPLSKSMQESHIALFKDVTENTGLSHKHLENEYDDFEKESLLPHKMSQFGPAIAVGDINNDGLEDFYVGGAKGFSGELYIQNISGKFTVSNNHTWVNDKAYEDVDARFFDVDKDGDLDLYVVSGGNEWKPNHSKYQDRLYINTKGKFNKAIDRLPKMYSSGSCVRPFDFDNDGDLDLFVGSRLLAQQYPHPGESFLLENVDGHFKNITSAKAPEIQHLGLITDAIWTDMDGDQVVELMIVGEWMPITVFRNINGVFQKDQDLFRNTNGWWNTVVGADMDNDGDIDYMAGNLGLNYKYKASVKEPFEVYSNDFDDNGTNDIVLGYYNQGNLFPLRGRECSSNQMPFIKEKFPTYDSFGNADLAQVYGAEKLSAALHLKATTFASVYIENKGDGTFEVKPLPNQAQVSSINAISISDFDNDGTKDLLVAGNMYQSEIETPRNDASYGLYLSNEGKGEFKAISAMDSGVLINGDVKEMHQIHLQGNTAILIGRNNDELIVLKSEELSSRKRSQ